MTLHTYRPMSEAPRDGTPIIAVCGGVEAAVCWHDPGVIPAAWWHWDDDELGPSMEAVRDTPTGWRKLF